MGYGVSQEENIITQGRPGYAGSYDGMSGMWAMILLIVVVLWVLFRDGHGKKDGGIDGALPYAMMAAPYLGGKGHGQGCDCGICVKDETNWEEHLRLAERMDTKYEKLAHEVAEQSEKTRMQAAQIDQRNQDREYSAALAKITALEGKISLQEEIGKVLGSQAAQSLAIERQFCRTDGEIAMLSCQTPKIPPFYAGYTCCEPPRQQRVTEVVEFRERGRRRHRDGEFECEGIAADY